MNKTMVQKSGHQLWGIYHTDREYARELSDPLRTVVEAPSKLIAEETAAQLGLSDPRAHLIAPEVVKITERILKRQPGHRSREFSTLANCPRTRFVRSRRPAMNYARHDIAVSACASENFPVQIQMIPFYDHV